MKHLLRIFGIVTLVAISIFACKNEIELPFHLIKYHTFDQVKEIAAKYDLENDSLISEQKNSVLMYSTTEKVNEYMKNLQQIRQEQKEWVIYYQRLPEVRSLQGLFDLQDSLPALRKLFVGDSEAAFLERREQLRSMKPHIYLEDGKLLNFVYPSDKSEHKGIWLNREER